MPPRLRLPARGAGYPRSYGVRPQELKLLGAQRFGLASFDAHELAAQRQEARPWLAQYCKSRPIGHAARGDPMGDMARDQGEAIEA